MNCAKLLILVVCIAVSGCNLKQLPSQSVDENQGLLLVYLQPLPDDAEPFRFELASLKAVGAAGEAVEYPLFLLRPVINGKEGKRQHLLASARVPAGTYAAVSCGVKSALVKQGETEASLLVPESPVLVPVHFTVGKGSAVVVALSLRYAESVKNGFDFHPVLSAVIPDSPVSAVAGFITNAAAGSITVFDKKSMQVSGAVGAGRLPRMALLDGQRNRAYVAISGDDAIDIVSTPEGKTINTIRLKTGDTPSDLALTPDGSVLLSVNSGSDSVSFIDTASLFELARVSVGQGPRSVLLDASGRRAYVFNTLSNTISVLNVSYRALQGNVSTEPEPLRGQFNRNGDRLYVICARSPYLLVYDPASLALLKREFVGVGMSSIKVDTRTDFFYLGMRDGTVGVYDPLSFSRADSIIVSGTPAALAIDGDENNLYVVIPERRAVSIVNLVSRKIISELDVSDGPTWVTITGER